ncbi:MAG: hypothetical protein E6R07_12815 [Nevskiaceae bacterium]|nr:MAG: hypothetical protein E6R07_12815 [Nevskiaceae bacterium]
MGALLDLAASSSSLWLDYGDYAGRLLAGGQVPWSDVSAYVAWQRKAQGLLKSDVIALPLAPLSEAWLAAHPGLREAMAGKRRAVFPIKTLLADEALRTHIAELLSGLRASFARQPLALVLPSPRAWIALAYRQAHGPQDDATSDADDVDSAAMYVADFLRSFGDCGIDALLLQETAGAEPTDAAELEWYRPVFNVCAHYRWDCGLHLPAAAHAPGAVEGLGFVVAPQRLDIGQSVVALDEAFWTGAEPPPATAGLRFAVVPAGASPEAVLDRLAVLR